MPSRRYINEGFLSGAQPIKTFKVLIDEELAKAQQRINGGLAVERYDETIVEEGGSKTM